MTQKNIDKKVDLRGEVCPYTFVKSKLAIEPLESGKIVKILVDYEPATDNVPESLKNEGHEILDVKKAKESVWEIIVRKK